MRTFVGSQEAVNEVELAELARGLDDLPHGFFPALFLGVPGEADEDGQGRGEAAEDMLPEVIWGGRDEYGNGDGPSIDALNAAYVAQLAAVTSLQSWCRSPRDSRRP